MLDRSTKYFQQSEQKAFSMLFLLHIIACLFILTSCGSGDEGEKAAGDNKATFIRSNKMAKEYCRQHKIREGYSRSDKVFTIIETCNYDNYSNDDKKLICLIRILKDYLACFSSYGGIQSYKSEDGKSEIIESISIGKIGQLEIFSWSISKPVSA